jgi:hypothetical protein
MKGSDASLKRGGAAYRGASVHAQRFCRRTVCRHSQLKVIIACVEVFDKEGEPCRRLQTHAMRPSGGPHWSYRNKLVWRATWVRLSVRRWGLTSGF